jgi:hypothetical protein
MGHFSSSLFIASTFVVLALSAGVISVGTVPVVVFLSTAPGTPCFCAMVTPGVKSAVRGEGEDVPRSLSEAFNWNCMVSARVM